MLIAVETKKFQSIRARENEDEEHRDDHVG
jgi:hypothetical protein